MVGGTEIVEYMFYQWSWESKVHLLCHALLSNIEGDVLQEAFSEPAAREARMRFHQ